MSYEPTQNSQLKTQNYSVTMSPNHVNFFWGFYFFWGAP